MTDPPRLTSLSTGGGCACKLPASVLHGLLAKLPRRADARLKFGEGRGDDAALYEVAPDLWLVQTVDFFSPIVDDPRTFGRIAAANALSDVYAVGGTPLTALNLVAFPTKTLSLDVLEAILAGGAEVCAEAACTVVGGHSIEDPEPKFGLAVTGVVRPGAAVTNRGAKVGDALVLGKPLGTGIVANALKKGVAPPAAVDEAVASMVKLNRDAARAMVAFGATAATDVTGFGLLAHLHNLLEASRCAAVIRSADVPVFGAARALIAEGHVPGGSKRNLEGAAAYTRFDPGVPADLRLLLADAQTSGGLCFTLPGERVAAVLAQLAAGGYRAARIGEIVAGSPGSVAVR